MAILMAPFAPHLAEELWSSAKNEGFVVNAKWPSAKTSNAVTLLQKESYFNDLCKEARRLHKLAAGKKEVKVSRIYISAGVPEWQRKAKEIIENAMAASPGVDFGTLMKMVNGDPTVQQQAGKAGKKMIPNVVKQAMGGGGGGGFDELEFLSELKGLIEKKVGFPVEIIVYGQGPKTKAKAPQPCKPSFEFE